MGKNASTILNIILIIAIVPLYLIHFSSDKEKKGAGKDQDRTDSLQASTDSLTTDSMAGSKGELRVAYVNWDTLMNEYQYVEDMLSELEKQKISMRKELEGKMRNLEQEYKKLKEESAYMTQSELKKAQKRMQRKQRKLKKEQRGLQGKLARKRQKMLKRFFDNVNEFLEDYNKKNKLDLILRYQRGGDVLFAKRGFNITDQVLEGLNKKYEKEGANKKLPKVSDSAKSPIPGQQPSLSP